jgi:hypothetical protein
LLIRRSLFGLVPTVVSRGAIWGSLDDGLLPKMVRNNIDKEGSKLLALCSNDGRARSTEAAVELSGGMICDLRDDSVVEVAVDFTHGTKILKVRNWDILPSNLYTHSILNFTIEEIVAQLIQQGLAPQAARRNIP